MSYNVIYLLVEHDNPEILSFTTKENAQRYQKALSDTHKYKLVESNVRQSTNAGNYIPWKDIPKHFNFVARDSRGVVAFRHIPTKVKWFNKDYSRHIRYGGEWSLLEGNNIYELVATGDIYERPGANSHFIDWNKLKNASFIKYFDNVNRTIEIFDKDGANIYIGSLHDMKIINPNATLQFGNSWFYSQQVYTFSKH